jgi:multisubunit Na+/H+ antiporter MnhG subunit
MVLDHSPSWLGWAGIIIGAITALAAIGLFLVPSLFPGFVLYGVLGSVIAQLWLLATGIVMLRRGYSTEKAGTEKVSTVKDGTEKA